MLSRLWAGTTVTLPASESFVPDSEARRHAEVGCPGGLDDLLAPFFTSSLFPPSYLTIPDSELY